MEKEVLELEKNYDGSVDHPVITVEESWVSGFDPDTKKGFKACTKTYRYYVLICSGANEYSVGIRTKVVYDDGTTLDWHWKEGRVPEEKDVRYFKILEKYVCSEG